MNPNLDFKYIMADASGAVAKAAKIIWPNIVRLMCYELYVHMVHICFPFTLSRLSLFQINK